MFSAELFASNLGHTYINLLTQNQKRIHLNFCLYQHVTTVKQMPY